MCVLCFFVVFLVFLISFAKVMVCDFPCLIPFSVHGCCEVTIWASLFSNKNVTEKRSGECMEMQVGGVTNRL